MAPTLSRRGGWTGISSQKVRSVGGRQTRAGALPLDLAATLGGGASDDVVPLVQHPLQLGGRLGWVGGDFGCQLQACLLGPGSRGDAVDKPQPQRLVGA